PPTAAGRVDQLALRLGEPVSVVDALDPDESDHLIALPQTDREPHPHLGGLPPQLLHLVPPLTLSNGESPVGPVGVCLPHAPEGGGLAILLLDRAQVDTRADPDGVRRRIAVRDDRCSDGPWLPGTRPGQLAIRRVSQ